MITQWFHAFLPTFVDHYGVVIATRGFRSHFLEFVYTRIRTIFATKFALEWWIRFVRGCDRAHDFVVAFNCLPTMRSTSRTQMFVGTPVLRGVRAKSGRKFTFQFCPSIREVRDRVEMRHVRYVVILPDVNSFGIISTIRRVIAKWFHSLFVALAHVSLIIVTSFGLNAKSLEFIHTRVL